MAMEKAQVDYSEDLAAEAKSIKEHSKELRQRIIYCVAFVGVVFILILSYGNDYLMNLILNPIRERNIELIYISLTEALEAKVKVTLLASLIVSFPFIFVQVWQFVRPAMYRNERTWFLLISSTAIMLFMAGITFGYLGVFLATITFFVDLGANLAKPMLSVSQYVSFMFSFVIPFGLIFEEPLFIYGLCKMGIVNVAMLRRSRKFMLLIIFIVAGFLTPPDVISQIAMALPMIILYEAGIFVAKQVESSDLSE